MIQLKNTPSWGGRWNRLRIKRSLKKPRRLLLEEWARGKPEPPTKCSVWQIWFLPVFQVSVYFCAAKDVVRYRGQKSVFCIP